MRKALIDSGVLSYNIRVIPHGIPNFTQECKKYGKNKKNKEKVKIILFGYVHENKGHHLAIEALQFLPKHYRLLICGKPRLHSHNHYFLQIENNGINV